MNKLSFTVTVILATALVPVSSAKAASNDKPYKILNTAQFMGSGGIDYVYADSDGRRIYVPRGNQVLVFDLDTLKAAGSITNARARGVAVDPKSHHGFCSSSPVVMWDTKTLETIKTIDVQGRPDGILFEPMTERIYVFSHAQPNVTVIDSKDGTVAGTIDLGGAPEQAASDGKGRLYVCLEDKDKIAVVDVKELKKLKDYDLGGKGGGPGGLGMDIKNNILFAMCHDPQTCVVLNADDGMILATLPIGRGTDDGGFNSNTMEAFSSQGDGTLTIIKENSPSSFEVSQTVKTKSRAKTCSLDSKTDNIILITTEPAPAATAATSTTAASASAAATVAAAPAAAAPAASTETAAATPASGTNQGGGAPRRGPRGDRGGGPAMLDIIVVGR